jgi:hypothetical protein
MGTRNLNGTFAPGNPGGPGRPRRCVEREYLAALVEAVSLEDWRAIVQKAVASAKAGNARAREWLSKYLVGDDPLALVELPEQLAELRREVEGLQHGDAQEYGPDPGSPLRAGPAA